MLRARTWPTSPPLDRHVEAIWRIVGDGAGLVDWLLPDVAGADLGVQLGAPATIDGAPSPRRLVVGGLARARGLGHADGTDTVGVRLAPACACLLGVPARELRDRVLPLDAVAPALDAALARWADAGADVAALPALLAAHVRPRCDRVVARAARLLAADDAPPVERVAAELGLSRRQLARRFRDATGTTARDWIRIARFHRACARASAAPARLATIAADAGYADQPHLDRDFRALVGAPPSVVLVSPPFKAIPPRRA